jgi:hypothetical protein
MLPKSAQQQPQSGNVILLVYEAGTWQRLQGEVDVDGGRLSLLQPGGPNVIDHIRKNRLSQVFGIPSNNENK